MYAAIVEGKIDTADVFFLVAVILAVIAAALYAAAEARITRWAPVLLSLAVGSVALALLVL